MALTVCRFGHVATTAQILEFEMRQDSMVDVYQTSPGIMRIRRGGYACSHLTADELDALRCGGLLDCVSALRAAGADVPTDGVLHVRMHAGGRRNRPAPDAVAAPVRTHWSRLRVPLPTIEETQRLFRQRRQVPSRAMVAPLDALSQALRCLEPELALAAAEAARALLPSDAVDDVLRGASRRVRQRLRAARL
ncbi:hypothetical protein [Gryllotalpicola ginsengisoli]|uniref:hypothetical protein n=1 Tax=Gryllotalpicola ginsengisoli TaxID=444608 RepID=UPI0003B2E535|nr:hypothetical protein [Gryllotalpicola ginsengisoli]